MNGRQAFLLPRTSSLDREAKSRQASTADTTCTSTSTPSNSFLGFPFMAQVCRVHNHFAAAAPGHDGVRQWRREVLAPRACLEPTRQASEFGRALSQPPRQR